MRRTAARLSLVAAGLAVVSLVAPASAATAPTTLKIVDPTGDAQGGQASTDIKAVRITTTGKTTSKKVGKKLVKTYTPSALVLTMELAAPAGSTPVLNWEIDFTSVGCGSVHLYRDGGDFTSGGHMDCGPAADPTDPTSGGTSVDAPVVEGSTITWMLPVASYPKEILTAVSEIHGFSYLADPLTGAGPGFVDDRGNIDNVNSDATYKP